jgi:hypothetical protein
MSQVGSTLFPSEFLSVTTWTDAQAKVWTSAARPGRGLMFLRLLHDASASRVASAARARKLRAAMVSEPCRIEEPGKIRSVS